MITVASMSTHITMYKPGCFPGIGLHCWPFPDSYQTRLWSGLGWNGDESRQSTPGLRHLEF